MGKKIRGGAAQISPYFFDKKKTLEKTCDYLQEAGRLGVDLLVFPEVYFAVIPIGGERSLFGSQPNSQRE
jgi:predicted amidohydrolase